MKRMGPLLAAGMLVCLPVSAATLVVDVSGTGPYVDIQSAIDAASSGDTILVKPGEYRLTKPLELKGRSLVLRSQDGPEATTIRRDPKATDLTRASLLILETGESEATLIEGFTFRGGKGTYFGESPYWSNGGGAVFLTSSSSPTFRSCGFTESTAEMGGAIYASDSAPSLVDCTFTGCSGVNFGGALYAVRSSIAILGCTFRDNHAVYRGGAIDASDSATLTLTDCVIEGNSCSSQGAGIGVNSCTLSLARCTISGNVCQGDGGGIGGGNCTLSLEDSRILGNAALSGGGISGYYAPISLVGCVVAGNAAETGGGVSYAGDSATFVHSTIAGNTAVWEGGGIFAFWTQPVLESSIVWGNGGGSFGVAPEGAPRAAYSTIEAAAPWPGEGNLNADPRFCAWGAEAVVTAASQEELLEALSSYSYALAADSSCRGAGKDGSDMGAAQGTCDDPGADARTVDLGPGTFDLRGISLANRVSLRGMGERDTTIVGTVFGLRTGAKLEGARVTTAAGRGIAVSVGEAPEIIRCTVSACPGGGIVCPGGSAPLLDGCTLSGNYAPWGGAIYSTGASPTFSGCLILGNASQVGAGVYAIRGGHPTFTNCVFAANSSRDGAALYCFGTAPLVVNSTIADNFTWTGGAGIFCGADPSPELRNCIVWSGAPDSPCGSISSTISGEDPLFVRPGVYDFERYVEVPVGDRVVRLPDFIVEPGNYRLTPGSPAIDAGASEGAPETDIEGRARPCGEAVDDGAYEYCGDGEEFPFRRGDTTGDGKVDISDPIRTLGFLFLGTGSPSCLDAADVDDSGGLDISDAVYCLNFLFLGASPPKSPFPACGVEDRADGLSCEAYDKCR